MIKTIAVGISAVAVLATVPAQAQSFGNIVGDLLDIGLSAKRPRSSHMQSTCAELAPPSVFVANATGDDPTDSYAAARGDRQRLAAREIMASATAKTTFRGWDGSDYGGDCKFLIDLQLPGEVAVQANMSPVVRYEASAKLTKRNDRWLLESVDMDNGFAAAELSRAVRAAADERVRQQQAREEARAELQRAEAAAAERKFAREHPAEYAERQRQSRQRARQFIDLFERAENARLANERACIARGGVWSRKLGLNGMPIGTPFCRTR